MVIKKIQVLFERNWEKIENTNRLIIKTESNEVDAGMASGPSPFLFDCGFNIITLNEANLESDKIYYNFTNLNQ